MLKKTKILIIGNGFGGVSALKNLHSVFGESKDIDLSLIGDKNYFLFTPLLHEVATGGINPLNIIEPIRKVLKYYLNDFYLGKVKEINLENKTVLVNDNLVSYDYLVISPGSQTNFFNTPGADKYAFTLKSIDDAVKIKNRCITQMERASHEKDPSERKKILKFVIVGGGPTGVELVAEMEELVRETFSHYYQDELIKDISIDLIIPPFYAKKVVLDNLRKICEKAKKYEISIFYLSDFEKIIDGEYKKINELPRIKPVST